MYVIHIYIIIYICILYIYMYYICNIYSILFIYVCMNNIYTHNMNMCVIHTCMDILSDRFGPQLKKHVVP